MSDRSIQEILSFNEQVIALAGAGLPLSLGYLGTGHGDVPMGSSRDSVTSLLAQSTAAVALRVGKGQALEQAIREEPGLPSNYRRSLLALLRCHDPRVAMESLFLPATTRQRFVSRVGGSLVYPLILAMIAYFGFLYLALVTIPAIDAMYGQLGRTAPVPIEFLTSVKLWIPVWSLVVPAILMIAVAWWKLRGRNRQWRWIPGSQRFYDAVENSLLADNLASMIESGCTLEESSQALLMNHGRRRRGPSDQPSSDAFPPLLSWAIGVEVADDQRAQLLRRVAETYRHIADRREQVWRLLLPTLLGITFGGLIVLAYGLSLFVPMIQLLKDVAIPVTGWGGN